jgi:hypothetical protein
LDCWFENKPSGNPGHRQAAATLKPEIEAEIETWINNQHKASLNLLLGVIETCGALFK